MRKWLKRLTVTVGLLVLVVVMTGLTVYWANRDIIVGRPLEPASPDVSLSPVFPPVEGWDEGSQPINCHPRTSPHRVIPGRPHIVSFLGVPHFASSLGAPRPEDLSVEGRHGAFMARSVV